MSSITALAALQALLLGHVAQQFFDLPLHLRELVHVARLGELGQLVQIDHADLRILGRFFQLLEQPIDRFQFFFDFDRLAARSSTAAGEIILRRQFVDFVFVSQPIDQLHQLPGKRRVIVAMGVPDPFQIANLLFLETPAEKFAQFFGRADLLAGFAISIAGRFLDGVGFVGLPEFCVCALRAPPSAIPASALIRRFGWDRFSPPGPVLPRKARAVRQRPACARTPA